MKNDYYRAIESFALRAFIIAIGIQLFTLLILIFGSDKVAAIHGAIIGIEEDRMEQFNYDVKLQLYLFVSAIKIAAIIFFGIPWAVLRFSKVFRNKE
ncbi:MAG: hypothetical protein VYB73_00520 [Verrucomicrobiota bacterium]|nr:hypothetical protein [Verrucomicrobiota bacterium]